MKSTHLFKVVSAGALAVGLAVMPATFPAAAQTSSDNPTVDTTPFQESTNDFNNLGWLGLIGLVGLANLFRKPKTSDRYNDPASPRT
ncbi:MAG TPA: WGxxGxxG family protein [Crinalium sp.]|jgi:hypothetical protein